MCNETRQKHRDKASCYAILVGLHVLFLDIIESLICHNLLMAGLSMDQNLLVFISCGIYLVTGEILKE